MTAIATQLPPCMCGAFWFISAVIWKTEALLYFADAAFHQEFFKGSWFTSRQTLGCQIFTHPFEL